jgi:hypothetical protein
MESLWRSTERSDLDCGITSPTAWIRLQLPELEPEERQKDRFHRGKADCSAHVATAMMVAAKYAADSTADALLLEGTTLAVSLSSSPGLSDGLQHVEPGLRDVTVARGEWPFAIRGFQRQSARHARGSKLTSMASLPKHYGGARREGSFNCLSFSTCSSSAAVRLSASDSAVFRVICNGFLASVGWRAAAVRAHLPAEVR